MRLAIFHITLCTTLMCNLLSAQHSPVISQYMLNGLPLNPAFAGSRDALSVAASYRNQWVGYDGAPVTQTFSIHTPLKNESLAVGLLMFSDKIGVSREIGMQGNAAYRMRLNNGKLSFGLSGGFSHYRNDWSEIKTNDADDEIFALGNDQFIIPNFSVGAYYYTSNWYLSVSAPFLLKASYSGGADYGPENDVASYNYFINGGMRMRLNQDLQFRPSLMMRMNSGSPLQLDMNSMLEWREFIEGGISIRTGDAIIGLLKVHITEQLLLGYAYDFTLTPINVYSNGTHEITLLYDFKYKKNVSNPRFF
jgi:type IX secretion system PorP/SprF family membrane protein